MHLKDTIIALATPSGAGALAVIRLSGPNSILMIDDFFNSIHSKKMINQRSHTIHLGHITDSGRVIDEVLVSIFKNPQSYTGENVVEISCHGSTYIQQEILQLFVRNGARIANPGEFTLRAFLNAKLDLSQAEAVADLIASENKASHQIAMQQMRGGFSNKIKELRDELLNFASLIELELDFSEEDVEFADRKQFQDLLNRIIKVLKYLIDSFSTGNVIKNGIPISIIGAPNVGKSTLLNALLNEDKAIVSDIAGTTRDAIEDEITIEGVKFRFIDTAGIRQTEDIIESIGIEKTFEKITQSQVILYLIDVSKLRSESITLFNNEIFKIQEKYPDKELIVVANKIDLADIRTVKKSIIYPHTLYTSAKSDMGISCLKTKLLEFVNTGVLRNNETIITNSRHYDSLLKALTEVLKVQKGIKAKLSGDLLAIDIRQALHHFGEITGEITSDDLLGNIFANFCIGK